MKTQTAPATEMRYLPLSAFVLSQTPMQIERRKMRTKEQITNRADTIKRVGVLHPIVGRPNPFREVSETSFEIVAGEGRYLSAEMAGLTEIPAIIRELTDEQVEEIQLIENLQRDDVHELVEALGYDTLMKRGHNVDEIAVQTGKKAGTIYARLKLLNLTPAARKAFAEGKITGSVALLLARIPVEKLQTQVLSEVTATRFANDEPMSYRRAAQHIHDNYMLALRDAHFPTDIDLAGAGPCGACPKRTGNQPTLFNDVKSADVCTDPPCFRGKTLAHAQSVAAKAKASGQTVITGKAAKDIAPNGTDHSMRGYSRLDEKCYSDPKTRTVRQIVGKEAETVLLQDPGSGALIEVVKESKIDAALKASGVRTGRASNPVEAARVKKAKAERQFRVTLYSEIRNKLPEKLARTDLEQLALTLFEHHHHECRKALCGLWQWEPKKGRAYKGQLLWEEAAAAQIPKLSDSELARFLLDCVFVDELQVSTYSDEKPERLLAIAKRLKVNVDAIRKQVAPAKASNKKASTK